MCAECEKSLPNQIVFDKIESIIRFMQDEQNGLPVKTAKSFMSKIPSVFTGTDLIQWMMRNLKLEDQQEAMHLANLIAAHGYIFPIEDHTLSIKNDCTFYRFQTPCLWPSNNSDPENTDYAVYLCKRTMQGKARLELADYEAENLARLQKMFSRKWEFIFMQAESQAKVDKKRDKLERKVLDSQERAFWDVYRPVPGCVNTTELDIKKACRLSKSAKRCAECQKVAAAQSGEPAPVLPAASSPEPSAPEPSARSAGEPPAPISKTVEIVEIIEEPPDEAAPTTVKVEIVEEGSEVADSASDSQQVSQPEVGGDTKQAAKTRPAAEPKAGQVSKGLGGHHHHQHQHQHQHIHHQHHHHHHHPHQHGHHHHHQHRQCPYHKQQQQQQQISAAREQKLSIPAESIITTTVAASASWLPAGEQLVAANSAQSAPGESSAAAGERQQERSKSCSKKRSIGSADHLMRAPSVQAAASRRKSECNRMLSMHDSPSAADELRAPQPDELKRPSSACCSYPSLEPRQASAKQRPASNSSQSGQQSQVMLRKSSLNVLHSSGDEPRSVIASSNSLAPTRKSASLLQSEHSALKATHSVCTTTGSSNSELAATGSAAYSSDGQNIGDLERELEALKVRLDRRIGGVKMSKVTQSYLSYFKQWAEYDPFIAQPIPSNPWISDSTELWESERQTKDVHCRRVRRWAFSLKELLNDPAGREQFHRFLEKEFSAENLKFWDVVQELKRVHSRDVARRVEAIWTEYLAQDANCPINIDSKSYETSKKNMAKNKNNRYIFDEAAGHVYQLMKNDSYPRYLRSEMYKDYKEASEKKRTNQVAFDVFKPQITTLKHKFNF